ncbi:MAG TPA: lysyl oxidase family protein [Candidatus Eisenbacteria bacterium]|jgi:hypothetical protein|nr:lysyl oxidase family protein [Candidatus Eisenbacteria bacterium]
MSRSVPFLALVLCISPLTSCVAADPDAETGVARQSLTAGALLPDIVEEVSHLGIWNQQQQEILRFSSTHWNQGAGRLQLRGATETGPCPPEITEGTLCTFAKQELLDAAGNVVETRNAGVALFHVEHNHWHMSDVARFELRAGSLDGPVVASTAKVTFCLIDYDSDPAFVSNRSSRNYFDCDGVYQGISPGWGDEYHHSTPGQWLVITGIPSGVYYLTHLANPAGNWLESNYANNFSWVKIRLSRTGANPEITELARPACPDEDQLICGNTSNK